MTKRILIMVSPHMEEAIMASGAIMALANHYPGARFTLVCESALTSELYQNLPNIEDIKVNHYKIKSTVFWKRFLREVGPHYWDLVIAMNRYQAMSGLVLRRKRLCLRDIPRREGHKVSAYSRLIADSKKPLAPLLPITDQHREKAASIVGAENKVLGLLPVSNDFLRDWPIEYYIDLVKKLTGPQGLMAGAPVFLTGDPSHRHDALFLLDSIPPSRRLDLYGRGHDILTLAACLERCRLVIGGDDGFLHLAAASYKPPVVGLFGPGDESWHGPWGTDVHIVRPDIAPDEWQNNRHGMAMIEVEAVFQACQKILSAKL